MNSENYISVYISNDLCAMTVTMIEW